MMKFVAFLTLLVTIVSGIQATNYIRERELKTIRRDFNHSFVVRKSDPNGARLDNFGRAVAIKPGVAIVGSPEHDDNSVATDAGAVFVYIEDENDWTLIRQIEDGEPGDYFGWAVALHTDKFAVVGACRGNLYGKFSGSAYYFYVETDPYAEQQIPIAIVQTERHGSAFYGFSVAINEYNGKVKAAVGAYGHRGKGAVFVYTRGTDGHLGAEEIIYATDGVANDNFGWSVSFYKNILVAGAPMDNNQGSAYVFIETGTGYLGINKLSQTMIEDDTNNPLYGDLYGMAVVAGDGFVAVAAPHNDVRGTDAGALYVYTLEEGKTDSYTFAQTLFAPNGASYNRFGWALCYDPINRRLAIGNDFSKAQAIGEAYTFSLSDTFYLTHEETIYPRNSLDDDVPEESDANFGYAVSIYGDYLMIGAELGRGVTFLSGDVYIYKAQTAKEAYAREHPSSSSNYSSEIEILDLIAIFLFVFVPLVVLPLIYMWRRYQLEGEGEGYLTFLTDEIANYVDDVKSSSLFKGKSSKSSVNSLKYAEVSDESTHSTHPLTSDYSSASSSASSSSGGGGGSGGRGTGGGSSRSDEKLSEPPRPERYSSRASTSTSSDVGAAGAAASSGSGSTYRDPNSKPKTKLSTLKQSTSSSTKGSAYQPSSSAAKYSHKPHDNL